MRSKHEVGRIVFRRRGMKTGGLLLMVFGGALVAGLLYNVVESGISAKSLANLCFYSLVFWLAWLGVLKPRVIVFDDSVLIDQALWIHKVPFRVLARSRTSSDGAVEFVTKDRRVFRSFAFGGSKAIRWTGLNKRAEELVHKVNQRRKAHGKVKKNSVDVANAFSRPSWILIVITSAIGVTTAVTLVLDLAAR